MSLKSVLMLFHLLGAVAVVGWALHQQSRLNGLARDAETVRQGDLLRLLHDLSRHMGLRHPPMLLISQRPHAPISFGVLRRVVVIPRELANRLDLSEIRVIFGHELAHHLRGDLWLNWAQ